MIQGNTEQSDTQSSIAYCTTHTQAYTSQYVSIHTYSTIQAQHIAIDIHANYGVVNKQTYAGFVLRVGLLFVVVCDIVEAMSESTPIPCTPPVPLQKNYRGSLLILYKLSKAPKKLKKPSPPKIYKKLKRFEKSFFAPKIFKIIKMAKKYGRPKGSKTKPPVIVTEENVKEIISQRSQSIYRMKAYHETKEVDRQFYLGLLELLKGKLELEIVEGTVHTTNPYRYTPRQMFDSIMFIFKYCLENGQPITISSLLTFLRLKQDAFWKLVREGQEVKEYMFLKDCVNFVQMYNEFALHKKQNPAGAIFALKNFGWKDKLEIEASSTQGALTEDERAAAQKRLAEFSEIR